jgi:hypothetical protein
MLKIKLYFFILVIVCVGQVHARYNIDDPKELYWKVKELYGKWHEGLFHSKNFYRKELTLLLRNSYRKKIITDYDFTIETPLDINQKQFNCRFKFGSWLEIRGYIAKKKLFEAYKESMLQDRDWWKSGVLVSITGKIRKFYLGRNKFGEIVILYLNNMSVKSINSKTKKDKK